MGLFSAWFKLFGTERVRKSDRLFADCFKIKYKAQVKTVCVE